MGGQTDRMAKTALGIFLTADVDIGLIETSECTQQKQADVKDAYYNMQRCTSATGVMPSTVWLYGANYYMVQRQSLPVVTMTVASCQRPKFS